MQINTIHTQTPKIQTPNTRTSPKQNFKGRYINHKNLNRIANTGIYTSMVSSVGAVCAGFTDPLLNTINLALTTIGTGAYFSKLFLPRAEKLALKAKTEFTKAQTLEQAQNFAKENFKIKEFYVDDLYAANWVNKGLTELSNFFKGKTFMPEKIVYEDFGGDTLDHFSAARYRKFGSTISINKFPFENTDRIVQNLLKDYSSDIASIPFGSQANLQRHLQRLNRYKEAPNTMTKASKLALATEANNVKSIFGTPIEKVKSYTDGLIAAHEQLDFHEQLAQVDTNMFGHVYCGLFDNIFHEAGHMFDFQSSTAFSFTRAERKMPQIMQKAREELVMPPYALSDFREYRAEIFAGTVNGEVYPKPIMDIFHKHNRIELPKQTLDLTLKK